MLLVFHVHSLFSQGDKTEKKKKNKVSLKSNLGKENSEGRLQS